MLEAMLTWLNNLPLAETMRSSLWGYPIGECLHLIGIVMLFGSILLVDLRFVGLSRGVNAQALSGGFLLRLTWAGFGLIVLSGLSLFSAYAPDTATNPAFRAKLVLIALAGVNMLFFHFRLYPRIAEWNEGVLPPTATRLSAGLSIVLWTITIFAGRLIAYPEMFEASPVG